METLGFGQFWLLPVSNKVSSLKNEKQIVLNLCLNLHMFSESRQGGGMLLRETIVVDCRCVVLDNKSFQNGLFWLSYAMS
jgi:hypothetical protein